MQSFDYPMMVLAHTGATREHQRGSTIRFPCLFKPFHFLGPKLLIIKSFVVIQELDAPDYLTLVFFYILFRERVSDFVKLGIRDSSEILNQILPKLKHKP